jgi:hypothetical protein
MDGVRLVDSGDMHGYREQMVNAFEVAADRDLETSEV